MTKSKKKTCYCKYKIDDVVDKIRSIEQQLKYFKETFASNHTFSIVSAKDNPAHIAFHGGMYKADTIYWLGVVCNKDPNTNTYGGKRPHWNSRWKIDDKGFHLESFEDESYKGWHGQYNPKNELKYDELPREALNAHHNFLILFLKEHFGIYYPCHIYNDFTGELHRP